MKKQNNSIRIKRLILIIFSVTTSCCGLAFLILKTLGNGISLTSDAWLSFWGSIIGSIVTISGIILTISYESKQNNTLRRLEAQPIIILKELPLNAVNTENEGSYSIHFDSVNTEEKLHFKFPDIEIHNIGLNFATKIDFHFNFKCGAKRCWIGGRKISILDSKENTRLSVSLDLTKECLLSFESFTVEKNKLFHACIARTVVFLVQSNRKERLDDIKRVSVLEGNIATTFEDIYGNTYMQEREAELCFVELYDEVPFVYMSFPEFAEAKLIERTF